MTIKTKTKAEILQDRVKVKIEGLIEPSIIKECPSPQCREYMINKNLEYTRRKIYEAIDEISTELLQDSTPVSTGHIKKTTTEQIKKQIQHNYEENKKKEMELFYKGVPIKIRYNRGNEKLWEETRE